jgi:predicted flap endonuclease-1-like 5' DNA nuclease
MIYSATSNEAAAAAAEAFRAWSDVFLSWSGLALTLPAERWSALARDCLCAQEASLRAVALASGMPLALPFDATGLLAIPFDATGLFPGLQPSRSSAASEGFRPPAASEGDADDLTQIRGVGARIQERLNELGIRQFNQLASLSEDDVQRLDAEIDGTDRVARYDWVGQAKTIGKGAEHGFQALSKPLGRADDLTGLRGVGPKIQERLNELGIYHYWQIASLTKSGVEGLDAELGGNGRVARDDWVQQAKQLAEDALA